MVVVAKVVVLVAVGVGGRRLGFLVVAVVEGLIGVGDVNVVSKEIQKVQIMHKIIQFGAN